MRTFLGCIFLVSSLSASPLAQAQPAVEWASLRECRIEVPKAMPPFVGRAVDDLRRILAFYAQPPPSVDQLHGDHAPRTILRLSLALNAVSRPVHDSAEAFSIAVTRSKTRGETHVSIEATSPQGLKCGVLELMRHLRVSTDGDVRIPLDLHLQRAPQFELRGMYAHLHWSYKRPYSLRAWEMEDWKRYIDLLAHLGFNAIQIWPMMELLPHPLSEADRGYLEQYARIVDYAHEQWNMKVFIGSCPNSITEDSRGVPVSRREYFDFEKRLDPGDPASLARILEYRSDLYRTVPNADGYWVIDSDPGGWPRSPSSDFVNILIGHRHLIDQYGRRPSEQPLIYWMWYGWGIGARPEKWAATLDDCVRRLPEFWRVEVCLPEQLEPWRRRGLTGRGIYFPYGLVEQEPSAPLTELRLERIDGEVRSSLDAGFTALVGNAQTPLLQLPNIAHLAQRAWGNDSSGTASLQELSAQLLCRDSDVLLKGWLALAGEDIGACRTTAARLRMLAVDPKARGPLAVTLGDWQPRMLEDLACLLEIRIAALRLVQAIQSNQAEASVVELLIAYLGSARSWLERTGYHNVRLLTHEAYSGCVVRQLELLQKRIGASRMKEHVWDVALRALQERGPSELSLGLVQTLRGERK